MPPSLPKLRTFWALAKLSIAVPGREIVTLERQFFVERLAAHTKACGCPVDSKFLILFWPTKYADSIV
jgi:hypothetical protein